MASAVSQTAKLRAIAPRAHALALAFALRHRPPRPCPGPCLCPSPSPPAPLPWPLPLPFAIAPRALARANAPVLMPMPVPTLRAVREADGDSRPSGVWAAMGSTGRLRVGRRGRGCSQAPLPGLGRDGWGGGGGRFMGFTQQVTGSHAGDCVVTFWGAGGGGGQSGQPPPTTHPRPQGNTEIKEARNLRLILATQTFFSL